jgi:hypothetical protein
MTFQATLASATGNEVLRHLIRYILENMKLKKKSLTDVLPVDRSDQILLWKSGSRLRESEMMDAAADMMVISSPDMGVSPNGYELLSPRALAALQSLRAKKPRKKAIIEPNVVPPLEPVVSAISVTKSCFTIS